MSRNIVLTYFENVQGEMNAYLGLSKEETIAKTRLIIPVTEPAFKDKDLVNAITNEIERCVFLLFHDMHELTVDTKSLADLEIERTRMVKETEEIFKRAEISEATEVTTETLKNEPSVAPEEPKDVFMS